MSEPRDGHAPVPMWLITLFGILVFWGAWYVAQYSGGWRGDVLDEEGPSQDDPAAKSPDPLVRGKALYLRNCVSCHQADGTGRPAENVPPLRGSEWAAGPSSRMRRIVLGGQTGPVRVAGRTYSGGVMPAFRLMPLADRQIADILTYVRANSEWGNGASAVSAEEVAATRAATATRTSPWTQEELLAITADDLPPSTHQAGGNP